MQGGILPLMLRYGGWQVGGKCGYSLNRARTNFRPLGRVNGRTSHRAEIRTTNFQRQYLLRFYPLNPKISTNPFTRFL